MTNDHQCKLPVPCATFEGAELFANRLVAEDVLVDTRGDWTQICQAHPSEAPETKWYVIVHTGNILGMISDLKSIGVL